MKLSVFQENLQKAVNAVIRSVPSRPQLPVLSNVLLKAEKGRLFVVGTDLSFSTGVAIGGKVEEEGAITVPAKDFCSLVSGLSADRVELSEEKGAFSVRSGSIRSRMSGISAIEFPDVMEKEGKGVEISLKDLCYAARRLLFAVGQDDSRPILTGVKMTALKEGGLGMIATDGYRLSSVVMSGKKHRLAQPVIIPARVLSDVIRLASGNVVRLQVFDAGEVQFSFDGGWISGKLLGGEYPPAERIIPEKLEMKISFGKSEFEQAVRVAAIFAKASANIVKMSIGKGRMSVTANSPQIGESEAEIEVDGEGEGEIAFNSRYLLDWIGSVESDRVEFGMVSSLKPGVFREQGNENYTHVIMPVRTNPSSEGSQK